MLKSGNLSLWDSGRQPVWNVDQNQVCVSEFRSSSLSKFDELCIGETSQIKYRNNEFVCLEAILEKRAYGLFNICTLN